MKRADIIQSFVDVEFEGDVELLIATILYVHGLVVSTANRAKEPDNHEASDVIQSFYRLAVKWREKRKVPVVPDDIHALADKLYVLDQKKFTVWFLKSWLYLEAPGICNVA